MELMNDLLLVEPINIEQRVIKGNLTRTKTNVFFVKKGDFQGKYIIVNNYSGIEIPVGKSKLFFIHKRDIVLVCDKEELDKIIKGECND